MLGTGFYAFPTRLALSRIELNMQGVIMAWKWKVEPWKLNHLQFPLESVGSF